MLSSGSIDDVTMESVAERAEVSRALVYKHFANRGDLLSALYERESAHLHATLAAGVERAGSLEEMLRALVVGALAAQAERGATFAAIAATGGTPQGQKDVQRRRDARTLQFFVRQATAELALDESTARAALGYVLSTLPVVLGQWRRRPTASNAQGLADLYVAMAMGGLRALARR